MPFVDPHSFNTKASKRPLNFTRTAIWSVSSIIWLAIYTLPPPLGPLIFAQILSEIDHRRSLFCFVPSGKVGTSEELDLECDFPCCTGEEEEPRGVGGSVRRETRHPTPYYRLGLGSGSQAACRLHYQLVSAFHYPELLQHICIVRGNPSYPKHVPSPKQVDSNPIL